MKLWANKMSRESLFTRSLAILEKTLSPSHSKLIAGLNNFAQLYRKAGREIEVTAMERRVA
jgi:hypothetical protein